MKASQKRNLATASLLLTALLTSGASSASGLLGGVAGNVGGAAGDLGGVVSNVDGVVGKVGDTVQSAGQLVTDLGNGQLAALAPVTTPVGNLVKTVGGDVTQLSVSLTNALTTGAVGAVGAAGAANGGLLAPVTNLVGSLTGAAGSATGAAGAANGGLLAPVTSLELLKSLRTEKPKLAILMLSMYSEDIYALRAIKHGAAGYLTKTVSAATLVAAVRKAAAGGRHISPELAEIFVDVIGGGNMARHAALSDRELEVLKLLAAGEKLVNIAQMLHLSPSTVTTYRARIMKKTGMGSNAKLARYALENGVLT
jgi:DNA-binding NarL/FixJ family response regulator